MAGAIYRLQVAQIQHTAWKESANHKLYATWLQVRSSWSTLRSTNHVVNTVVKHAINTVVKYAVNTVVNQPCGQHCLCSPLPPVINSPVHLRRAKIC